MTSNILIVDDNESMLDMLKQSLSEEASFRVMTAKGGRDALSKIKNDPPFDLVISDMEMPYVSGMDILKELNKVSSETSLIFITAYGTIEKAVSAVKEGAFDFITKPFEPQHLIATAKKALKYKKIRLKNKNFDGKFSPLLKTQSPAMKKVYEELHKVANSSATVLLLGESGTGKEIIAQTIHQESPRASAPIISINCAAISHELLESELFGHEKGSFTGAEKRKLGKFELANKGTLFLDEIGDMDISIQAKLLRAIQESAFEMVGGTSTIKVDIRLICATNKDLSSMAEKGEFRNDLFYRIGVFPIYLPPLRERKEDIPALSKYFVEKYSQKMEIPTKTISPEAMKSLKEKRWPGNIRELENSVERAIILSDTETLYSRHFYGFFGSTSQQTSNYSEEKSLESTVREVTQKAEIDYIKAALAKTAGNKLKAAKHLKISYKTLLTKIKKYNLAF